MIEVVEVNEKFFSEIPTLTTLSLNSSPAIAETLFQENKTLAGEQLFTTLVNIDRSSIIATRYLQLNINTLRTSNKGTNP
ncbi:unnamed protein product, partial [Iphiclides podalirius]